MISSELSEAVRGADTLSRFAAFAKKQAKLSREQAMTAMRRLQKEKLLKVDPVTGDFRVKHGRALDPDVLRRAAGLDD